MADRSGSYGQLMAGAVASPRPSRLSPGLMAWGLCMALCADAAPIERNQTTHATKRRPPALVAAAKPQTARTQVSPAARSPDVGERQAERRLLDIYHLIAQAQIRLALAQAQALVRDFPHFQLAQLVYGDLLTAHSAPLRKLGDVTEPLLSSAAPTLTELREESRMRLLALREPPPPGTVPAQFVTLSPRTKHAIAVDASRARLYLFENRPSGLTLLANYYISVGKAGLDKYLEGDSRTPLGVYFITSNLDPKSLTDFYGSGALPINYPNVLDTKRGKTGSGIWLHGTPPAQFARAPLATNGCVVLANADLNHIIRTVEVGSTPVVIAQQLNWIPPSSVRSEVKPFEAALSAWRKAKSSGDMTQLLSFYEADFSSNGKGLNEWLPSLRQELGLGRGRAIELKDLSLLRWTDSADTMIVTFGEVASGTRSGPTKRQYWIRRGSQWKIFYEGIIG